MAATAASPDDESEAMYWADAHCHIQDRRLSLSVVRAAEEANVVRIAVCATHPDDWDDVEELWRSNPDLVIPSFGVHPFRVEDAPPDWETALRERLCRIREACVGECGLDRSPNGIKRAAWETQLDFCERQLGVAKELNRPVSVHCVQAQGAMENLLRRARPERGVLLHSYGMSPEAVSLFDRLGCYFSFSGMITNPRAKKARASVAAVPLDKLLVETDAPDQLPTSLRDIALNEPQHIVHVGRALAELRGVPLSTIAAVTRRNMEQFFRGN